jgi:hypothetical protein
VGLLKEYLPLRDVSDAGAFGDKALVVYIGRYVLLTFVRYVWYIHTYVCMYVPDVSNEIRDSLNRIETKLDTIFESVCHVYVTSMFAITQSKLFAAAVVHHCVANPDVDLKQSNKYTFNFTVDFIANLLFHARYYCSLKLCEQLETVVLSNIIYLYKSVVWFGILSSYYIFLRSTNSLCKMTT